MISIVNLNGGATLESGIVRLAWKNPIDPSFNFVSVFRRPDDFQTDPASPFGIEIYRGTAEEIYDYHLLNPAELTLEETIKKKNNLTEEELQNALLGEKTYYYTVFTVNSSNEYFSNLATMVALKPVLSYNIGERLYQNLPELYKLEDKENHLKDFLGVLGRGFDFVYSKMNMTQDSVNVDKVDKDKLQLLAGNIGWDLNTSLSISDQKNSLRSAVSIYKSAGTKAGLDRLVKYYSGFPLTSGISEGSSIIMDTPYFGTTSTSPILYLECITPDFNTMDFSLIGSMNDPLHYSMDFSFNAKANANSFRIIIQPTFELTSEQEQVIRDRVDSIISQFAPAGTSYDINILG